MGLRGSNGPVVKVLAQRPDGRQFEAKCTPQFVAHWALTSDSGRSGTMLAADIVCKIVYALCPRLEWIAKVYARCTVRCIRVLLSLTRDRNIDYLG